MLNCFVILFTKRAFKSLRYTKKQRAFHLNSAHYSKPHIVSSVYSDQKLQRVEEYK